MTQTFTFTTPAEALQYGTGLVATDNNPCRNVQVTGSTVIVHVGHEDGHLVVSPTAPAAIAATDDGIHCAADETARYNSVTEQRLIDRLYAHSIEAAIIDHHFNAKGFAVITLTPVNTTITELVHWMKYTGIKNFDVTTERVTITGLIPNEDAKVATIRRLAAERAANRAA